MGLKDVMKEERDEKEYGEEDQRKSRELSLL